MPTHTDPQDTLAMRLEIPRVELEGAPKAYAGHRPALPAVLVSYLTPDHNQRDIDLAESNRIKLKQNGKLAQASAQQTVPTHTKPQDKLAMNLKKDTPRAYAGHRPASPADLGSYFTSLDHAPVPASTNRGMRALAPECRNSPS